MIENRHITIRFNTNLPYNCIYYIYGNQNVKTDILSERIDNKYVSKLQGFSFQLQKIERESLTENALRQENCIAPDTNPALTEDIMQTLQQIFPKSELGCFVVRLLPYHDQLDDNYVDTLFIGETIMSHG